MTIDTRLRVAPVWKRYARPDIGGDAGVVQPAAPTNLSSSAITNTSVTLTWTRSVTPGITEQRIYLNNTQYTTVANGTASSVVISGLTPGTPYIWKMTAHNATTGLTSPFSATYSMTTTSTQVTNAPNTPGNFTAVKTPASPTSSINVTWAAPVVDATHQAQTGYRIYADGVLQGGDRAASATSATLTGLIPGEVYTVTMKAFNATGESASTTGINVTLDNVTTTMLMGCSTSNNDHGATEDWDGWRTYNSASLYSYANRTGANRPLFIAYSADGPNLGGTNPVYATVLEQVLDELDTFYYTGSAANHTGGTQSTRWGIKLYWSNGNENYDKGVLATHNATTIGLYVESQRALYDGVHFIDPGTGQRRYPDAFAGSNPTQNSEYDGKVEAWLHPSARYHDFVMWSMYPPGRNTTTADPTYNWPGFVETQRSDLRLGYLIRCFYRTAQARAAARSATGNPSYQIAIGCGEVGIGDDPNDSTTRPYYAVHGLAGGMQKLATQYNLPMPFACWWDNQVDAAAPQNILTDEAVGTNPSTRVAWQNWRTYNHEFNGTHPASWAGNPKAAWKTTGTVI